jgi:chemosensory pili system protein ChpA (sensor histidine kinase/response regulator)
MQSEQQQRIMGYFIEEAKDHLNTIEQGLLNLQGTIEDPDMISEVFRAAHSVKGGAAMLGLDSIQQTSHRLEDYFKVLKECSVQIDQKLETLLLRVFDTLQDLLEQLQGPFGLPDDKAREIMADVKPVFNELNRHLRDLVAQTGSNPPSDVDLSIPAEVTANLNEQTVVAENPPWQTVFSTDVPERLRAMLHIFKQSEQANSRQELQDICQQLIYIGEQFQLSAWITLIQTAQRAIANSDNSFRVLAPIVIKEIKQAQERVLADNIDGIQASETLATLLPATESTATDLEDFDLDRLMTDDSWVSGASDLDIDFATNLPTTEGSHDFDKSWLTELDAMSDNAEDRDSEDSSLFSEIDEATPSDDSQFEDLFADVSEPERPASTPHPISRSGPEVGMAELNSLADLFESEVPDLDITWQDDDSMKSTQEGISDSLEFDESNDFSDLLFDHDNTETLVSSDANTDDDLSGLLNSSEVEANLTDEISSEFSNLAALDELVDSLDSVLDPATPSDSDVSVDSNSDDSNSDRIFNDGFEDASFQASSDHESIDQLGEFFAEFDDPASTTDAFASDAQIADTAANPETDANVNSETDDLDALFDEITDEPVAAEIDDDDVDVTSDLWDSQASDRPLEEQFGDRALSDNPETLELSLEDLDLNAADFDWEQLSSDSNTSSVTNLDQETQQTNSGEIPEADFNSQVTEVDEVDTEISSEDVTHDQLEVEPEDDIAEDIGQDSAPAANTASSEETLGTTETSTSDDLSALFDSESDSESSDRIFGDDADLTDDWLNGQDLVSFDLELSPQDEEENPFSEAALASEPVSETSEASILDTFDDPSTSENLDGLDTTDDLDAMLGESEPEADTAEAISESAAKSTAETSDASTDLSDEFADLEALLATHDESPEPAPPEPDIFSLESESDLAELDALLDDEIPVGDADLAEPIGLDSDALAEAEDEDSEFDDLERLLADADKTLGGPPTVLSNRRSSPSAARRTGRRGVLTDQTMRVSVKHLDNLNNLVGELVVNRNSLEQAQERLRQFLDNLLYQVQQLSDVGQRMRDLYERSLLESSLLSSRRSYHLSSHSPNMPSHAVHSTGASFDALEMDRFTGFHTLSQEMIELIVRVRESASDIDFVVDENDQITRMFRQVTTQLQEGLTRSRMVPFAQAADRLPRAVRDISIKCGKQAELVVEGRETLIDKMILEQLYDPMTHLVNNAITHGIELPETRIASGKPPTGKITIRTFHQGNQTVISVTDDGAGIDPAVVTQKAIERSLITPEEAQTMSQLDIYDLLFHHGFSTKDKADDFSGRGVGMDVVRTSLNEIRGVINIDSTVGRGTTFTIRLPLTLSISKALLCVSNRARIAFPMDGVEDMLDVPKERIQTDEQGRSCILWRDTLLPFHPLADLLRYNRVLGRGSVYGGNQEDDIVSVVVLRSAGNFLALQVDQVMGEQEIVIKQLEPPVPKPIGIAGATVLGDGRIMPIADVLELIDLSMGRIRREAGSSLWEKDHSEPPAETPAIKSEPTVLIVDDSITVRELLSMTFIKVGYRVEQARDGQEAWEKLRSGLPCQLVFCDIEMPRMDGLELLSRIQKDPHLSDLPVAMLTSRGADRHRQMAVQLGAKGYFTKPYLEEALLDAAQRMLKGEVLVTPEAEE